MTATLCPKATRSSSSLNPLSFSRSLTHPKPHRLSFPKLSTVVTMSSSSVVEHIVLFKVKDNTDPATVNSTVNGLNGLTSLNLTAGTLLRTKASPFAFTHLLHSRYNSKDDLAAYSAHPGHVGVVKESVLPICDDIMAVDWVAEGLTGPAALAPGSAIRVTFLKLKEEEAAKGEVVEVVKGKFGEVGQTSAGENFLPARAKGYSVASVAVSDGVSVMEAVDSKEEPANIDKDNVRECLESVIHCFLKC